MKHQIHAYERRHGRNLQMRRRYNQRLLGGARQKTRHIRKKQMRIDDIKRTGRMAITFGEVSTTHIGGREQGKKHARGFSVQQLRQLQRLVDSAAAPYNERNDGRSPPVTTEYVDLSTSEYPETKEKENEAGVLILRNGANLFTGDVVRTTGADRLLLEQYRKVVWDRSSYNARQDKYTNKRSRYNTVFTAGERETQNVWGWYFPDEHIKTKADRIQRRRTISQPSTSFGAHTITGHTKVDAAQVTHDGDPVFARPSFILHRTDPSGNLRPEFVESTRNPFSELPLLSTVRQSISFYTNQIDEEQKGNDLNAEGNWYREGTLQQIGWHGDGERRIVICLCLGTTAPLYYAWRAPGDSGNLAIRKLVVNHGDIYIMSSKATGSDWKSRNRWRLVHGAGNLQLKPKSK